MTKHISKLIQNCSVLITIWEMKDKYNISLNLMWCIVKSVPGYSNFSKRCMLSLNEKYEILNHPDQEELLNKRSELVY